MEAAATNNPPAGYTRVGIAVDGGGNAYVTGLTTSADFPTTAGAFQTVKSGGYVAFVTKLDPTGAGLIYSTYLGAHFTWGFAIAVDENGSAYVTGSTSGSHFPTTPGAFQTTQPAGSRFGNAFVTKLDPTGSGLIYSSYLGGSVGTNVGHGVYGDAGFGIAVDAGGNAYITGYTSSTDFPTTPGAFQTSFAGGGTTTGTDAFLTKMNATGSGLTYSSYLGGSDDDVGFGLALDASGNAYVTGYTASTNFPTTAGAFQTVLAGGTDTFITKVGPSGSALLYSTYVGGTNDEQANSIAVDVSGDAFITGNTNSDDFPTTAGAFETTGGNGAFITKLNPLGAGLLYSTYLAGAVGAQGRGIAVDGSGNA